jgi:hypothetical protein
MKERGIMGVGEKLRREAWKKFIRRHPKMTAAIVGAIVAASIAAVLVFLWVVGDAQETGRVPSGLGEWTVGYFFTFIIHLILWELILVASWGIPIAVLIYALWYRHLPAEERAEYKGGPRRSKTAGESSGFSFFVWLVWLAVVWLDGRWNLAFEDWTFDNLVYSWLVACLVCLLIAGIPALIYVVWCLGRNGE